MTNTIRATLGRDAFEATKQWRLHVIASPDKLSCGRVVELGGGETCVGRSAGNGPRAVTIDDQRLSRRHATLHVDIQSEDIAVEDLQSSNGTWIRGKRVHRQPLRHGAVLRIGNTVAVVEHDLGRASAFIGSIPGIPGASEAARQLREQTTTLARSGVTILVSGADGAGKGKLAREIHRQSGRTGTKVAVRMEDSAGDEAFDMLFGGGRHGNGLIEQSSGGTLILGRCDRMAESLQIAIRRLLGDPDRMYDYDVRIVALAERSLMELADAGQFDLRLAELLSEHHIELQPLALRKMDVVALADVVAPLGDNRYASTWGSALDADAAEMLLHYAWPGNLEELKTILTPLSRTMGADGCKVDDLPASLIRDVKDSLHGRSQGGLRKLTNNAPVRPSYTAVQLCHLLAVHGGVKEMAVALGYSQTELIRMFREVDA